MSPRRRALLVIVIAAAAMVPSTAAGAARSAHKDPIGAFRTAKTVEEGRPLIIRLVMRRAESVTIEVRRLRREHGRHRGHRGRHRYVTLLVAPFSCVAGLNRLEIAEWHRHKFKRGRYIVVALDPHYRHRIRVTVVR